MSGNETYGGGLPDFTIQAGCSGRSQRNVCVIGRDGLKKVSSIFFSLIISCVCLLATQQTTYAQPNLPPEKADSLFAVWNDETQPDSSRLNAMSDIAWHGYLYTKPDSAFYYAQLRYDFAKRKNLKEHMASALNAQAASWEVRAKVDKAIDYYTKSLQIYEEIGDKKGMAKSISNMGVAYQAQSDYDKAIDCFSKCIQFGEELGDKVSVANSTAAIGLLYKEKGNYAKAMDYYTKGLQMYEEIGSKIGKAKALVNIGSIYKFQGDYSKAIDHYTRGLYTFEELGNKEDMAISFLNIGVIYSHLGDYTKAIDYYIKSLQLDEEIGNKEGIARDFIGIGNIYKNQGDLANAIDYFTKSLAICNEIGRKPGIALNLNNIGTVYLLQGDYLKALDYYSKSLQINEEIGNSEGIATNLVNIGLIYNDQNDYTKALEFGKRSFALAQEVGHVSSTQEAAELLWVVHKNLGRFDESLKYYELYITSRDSLESEANQKEVIRQEYKYEYEKQAAADSVVNAEAAKVQNALLTAEQAEKKRLKSEGKRQKLENKNQQQQAYFLYGGLALALLFGGFIFNRFRVTQKQKGIIESQKDEVEQQKEKVDEAYEQLEEKNTEILDSINYAKRIQSAILPPDKLVKEYLQDSFILYKPKDIVAGDFYWMEPTKNGILFAAADCTGHGVPGAMVSVVCNNALNRSVREYGLTDPGKILDKTREIVIQEFEKSEDEVKDGMDIALCSLQGNTLHYAGAHNPLWIVTDKSEHHAGLIEAANGSIFRLTQDDPTVIIEIKANKQPIGQFDTPLPYNTHTFELQPNDTVYIFSDGYVDQFGGERGKKYKPKALRQLLLSIQDHPMDKQRSLIDAAFENWRGDLEQVDDVCVIGVKI
jgi:tetratricopeptide (TPR) repeat protein/serine phosphatase RsbU (regulator of sigma subunit)